MALEKVSTPLNTLLPSEGGKKLLGLQVNCEKLWELNSWYSAVNVTSLQHGMIIKQKEVAPGV